MISGRMSSPSEMALMQRIDPDGFRKFIVNDLHVYVEKSLVSEGDLSFMVAFRGRYCLRIYK